MPFLHRHAAVVVFSISMTVPCMIVAVDMTCSLTWLCWGFVLVAVIGVIALMVMTCIGMLMADCVCLLWAVTVAVPMTVIMTAMTVSVMPTQYGKIDQVDCNACDC